MSPLRKHTFIHVFAPSPSWPCFSSGCCYSSCQRMGRGSINEWTTEWAEASVQGAGWWEAAKRLMFISSLWLDYTSLFPCSLSMLCLPLNPSTSLPNVHSWRHFSSCAAYIWENFLWFILISSIYMQFLFFFALKILLLFKTSSHGLLFSLLWNYVFAPFFPIYPVTIYYPRYLWVKSYVAPGTQNSKGNSNISFESFPVWWPRF